MSLDTQDAEDHGVDAVQALSEDAATSWLVGPDPALLRLEGIPLNDDHSVASHPPVRSG
jgi:hypothetical protein